MTELEREFRRLREDWFLNHDRDWERRDAFDAQTEAMLVAALTGPTEPAQDRRP